MFFGTSDADPNLQTAFTETPEEHPEAGRLCPELGIPADQLGVMSTNSIQDLCIFGCLAMIYSEAPINSADSFWALETPYSSSRVASVIKGGEGRTGPIHAMDFQDRSLKGDSQRSQRSHARALANMSLRVGLLGHPGSPNSRSGIRVFHPNMPEEAGLLTTPLQHGYTSLSASCFIVCLPQLRRLATHHPPGEIGEEGYSTRHPPWTREFSSEDPHENRHDPGPGVRSPVAPSSFFKGRVTGVNRGQQGDQTWAPRSTPLLLEGEPGWVDQPEKLMSTRNRSF